MNQVLYTSSYYRQSKFLVQEDIQFSRNIYKALDDYQAKLEDHNFSSYDHQCIIMPRSPSTVTNDSIRKTCLVYAFTYEGRGEESLINSVKISIYLLISHAEKSYQNSENSPKFEKITLKMPGLGTSFFYQRKQCFSYRPASLFKVQI